MSPFTTRLPKGFAAFRVLGALCTLFALVALLGITGDAVAALGYRELAENGQSGPITLYYPSAAEEQTVERGRFRFLAAMDAPPGPGNGRLVVISHGSGASPWVYGDLARALVDAGFTVAIPEHRGDNHREHQDVGPVSWARRPQEISAALDRLQAEPALGDRVDFTRVGVYGMSAGGHTALVLAGGRWSPARLLAHCRENLEADFAGCAGPTTRLTGGWGDAMKKRLVLGVLAFRLADSNGYGHQDPRVVAVVAGVPLATDFDPDSLAVPRTDLALVRAGADHWLNPRFHGDAVLAACTPRCRLLADLPLGGHGALLSPLPPNPDPLVAELLADAPGFDRAAEVARLNKALVAHFRARLLAR